MQWNSTFSIGVEKIDGQHRRLFQLANQLEKELAGQQSAESVGEALKFLVDYTSYHFKDEESLMAQISYPDLGAHRELHKQLIDKVRALLLDIRTGGLPTVADLISFLYQWIVEHIEQEDKKIGSAVREYQRFSAASDTPADIVRRSTTHEINANLTKLRVLLEKQVVTVTDAQAYKTTLLDKFISGFKPTSTIEVIEEYAGLKALVDAELITASEMEAIRPRFAERIDLQAMLTNDHAVGASMAHLHELVGQGLIDAAACERHAKRLLGKTR